MKVRMIHFAMLFAGALITILIPKGKIRNTFLVLLPAGAFAYIANMTMGDGPSFSFLPGFGDVEPLRVDKLSKAFGYIFTLNAAVAMLFAFYVKKAFQHLQCMKI